MHPDAPLRIAFLTYRGNPHAGGQGVYARHLTRALVELGHTVEVLSGQPYPDLDRRVPLVRLPSFDLYNAARPLRLPPPTRIRTLGDVVELLTFATLAFPEPLAFSVRAASHLARRRRDFDVVHDNQSLGWGLLAIRRLGFPVLATVHHPITIDLRLELARAESWRRRLLWRRWYAFTRMQRRVAPHLDRIVTDSVSSADAVRADLGVPAARLHVVPIGVDPAIFRPRADVAEIPDRIVTTASADSATKGLPHLLEALARLRARRPAELVVIGRARPGGPTARRIRDLGLADAVRFESAVDEERLVALYNEAAVVAVPSLYEGFSLPAIEAQACGRALVGTTGGALPEVAGRDGETALLVPPGDAAALAAALDRLLADRALRARLGAAGRARVERRWTWRRAAERTAEHYRAMLGEPRHAAADVMAVGC
jgi:glycosyltransferase involved in cell wall biosynthesis